MPIYNWFKINATGNLTWLRHKPLREFEHSEFLEELWFRVYDNFIDTFGITEEFEQLLKLKHRQIQQLSDYVIKDDKFKLTEADITEAEIEQIMLSNPDIDDAETMVMIEQQLGFKINPHEVSVLEYYNYLKFIGKQLKKANNG